MGPDIRREYGLGLSSSGHAVLVISYTIVLSLIAGFGGGRVWEGTSVWRSVFSALGQQHAAYEQIQNAWSKAARENSGAPKSSTSVPHTISAYPPLARRLGQQGDVRLDILVLPTGQVGEVRVARSSGFAQLDAAALVGVGDWYYVPAMRNHVPVKAWTKANIRFRLTP